MNPARAVADDVDDDFVPPVNFVPPTPAEMPSPAFRDPRPVASEPALPALKSATGDRLAQPDPDIECVITLQPVRPVTAGAVAAGLHARVGKPLRWFGRVGADAAWQLLKSDTVGEWRELAACMLLADRAGAATRPLIDRFIRLVDRPGLGAAGARSSPPIRQPRLRAPKRLTRCAPISTSRSASPC